MQRMQHACQEAARLMSLQRDEPLSAAQQARLAWHVKICGDCQAVERQLALLDALQQRLFRGQEPPPQR
jgi:hypothetical protein